MLAPNDFLYPRMPGERFTVKNNGSIVCFSSGAKAKRIQDGGGLIARGSATPAMPAADFTT